MAIYVDSMYAPHWRMKMCHMIADSREELDAMADKIGIARKWIQDAGTYREHYDIAMSKRAQAISAGAVEVSRRELGRILYSRNPHNRRI
jgi:hypothetical protein